ncbi:mevalonate kinase [Candidatus Gottesmanbacteria bacterium]|nr:mevalonate kinase [Candidatus Gottesmanbacteria bacterium]
MIKVSAPGKIHFLGEHAIVFGKPAILAAINLRCVVSLNPNKTGKIKTFSRQLVKGKERFDAIDIAVSETFKFLKKPKALGFNLQLDSKIPVGCGLGSSAAVSVSVIGALFLLLGEKFDKKKINQIAYLTEQKIHGFPSGGDNSTATYGGLVWYRKEAEDLKIIEPLPFLLAKNLARNFVLIDTGRPKETTGEMVAGVRKLFGKRPQWTEKIFNDQEKLVKKLLSALKENNERLVMETIRLGERNLEKIGVVGNFSHDLIRQVESLGGVAKICGAGGDKDRSGILLAYHVKPELLVALTKKLNLNSYVVALGEEGVRQDG